MNEMEKSLISIIIPYYNTEARKFENCIRSVINQTYRNTEILIIDDYSRAEFANYLDEIAQRDNRITVYHREENCGLSKVRNYGISICKGDYVCFVDSDDMLNYNTLKTLFLKIKETNSDLIIGHMHTIFKYADADVEAIPDAECVMYDTVEAIECMITSRDFGSGACCRFALKSTWLKNSENMKKKDFLLLKI